MAQIQEALKAVDEVIDIAKAAQNLRSTKLMTECLTFFAVYVYIYIAYKYVVIV